MAEKKRRRRNIPCLKCGGPKEPGQGKRWCAECHELVKWETEKRRQAKAKAKRLPCKDCGGVKEPGPSQIYCNACKEKRSYNKCWRCKQYNIKRPSKDNHCLSCKEEVKAERRKKDNARKRANRKDPVKLARMRANGRTYKARVMADPVKHAAQLEQRRIEYRLRNERKGGVKSRVISLEAYRKGKGKLDRTNRLSSAPLRELLIQAGGDHLELSRQIGVDEGVIRRIINGQETEKHITTADQICTGLGTSLSIVYGDDFLVGRATALDNAQDAC